MIPRLGSWTKTGTKALVGIYHDDIVLKREPIQKSHRLRKEAYQDFTGSYFVDKTLRTIQHFIAFVLTAVVVPTLLGLSIYSYVTHPPSTPYAVALFSNIAVFLLWLLFSTFHIYQSCQRDQSPWLSSKIKAILIQDILAETTVSAMIATSVIDAFILEELSLIYVCVCSLAFLILWICRLIAMLQFKHEIAVLFDKMVFMIVGNALIKIVLILITCRAYSLDVDGNVANLPLLVTAGIVTTITYPMNIAGFYACYAYEITAQSCFILLEEPGKATDAKQLLDDLHDLPVFHKNMFPLAFTKFGVFIFTWLIPVATISFFSTSDTVELVLLIVYCLLNIVFNHRMLMMSLLTYLTLAGIILFVLIVLCVSAVFTILYYTTCGIPILFILFALMIKKTVCE